MKQGMIYPFAEFLDRCVVAYYFRRLYVFLLNIKYHDQIFSLFIRFKGQKQLHKSKPIDFQMAIEEALLAEDGYVDASVGSMLMALREADVSGMPDASTSNQDLEYYSEKVTFFRIDFVFFGLLFTEVLCFGALNLSSE